MWQKQQQVGSHMACALFVNLLAEWKVWKRHSRVCWTKITSSIILETSTKRTIFNLGQKVWKAFKFESLLAGVDSLVLVGRKIDRGKTRSSLVVVRNCCSLSVRAQRCRTVSSSVHWKLVSYHFLVLVRWQCCPFFWGLLQMLNAIFASVKAGSEI